jgi:putative transposase
MRLNGIRACRGKIKSRPRSAPAARRPEIVDHVQQDFHADTENAVWFTDVTLIRTLEGWLWAAVILDGFNREVISWAVELYESPKTALRALAEAVTIRRPPRGCIIHSDRGYQFTSKDWLILAENHGLQVSMGQTKTPHDNAAMESWFASFKNEALYPFGLPRTRHQARQILFNYIWQYNTQRRHSSLGYVAPRVYATESSICP